MRVLAGNSARNLAWHNVSDTAIERVSWRSDGGKIDLMGTSPPRRCPYPPLSLFKCDALG